MQWPTRMRTPKLLTLAPLAWSFCLIVSAGCRSVPTEEEPLAAPTAGRQATPEEEITLISADSEVFAAVVRAQLGGEDDEYPYHLERLRYDARPYGTSSGYPELFAGVQGIDPTLTFARATRPAVKRLIENRKEILKINGVPQGGLIAYSQCAGAGVPAPPPPRGSSSATRSKSRDVHAGCPKAPEYYLTVGLPVRGQPTGLRNARNLRGDRVTLRGEVWTTLVDEHSAGPGGWRRSQYAWLFQRTRSGRLELAGVILVGVIQ